MSTPIKKNIYITGFTLIELLVVIAIIGTLSTVVIANIRTSRFKGMDAAAMATLKSGQAEAANFYDTFGSFAPLHNAATDVCCPGNSGITCDASFLGTTATSFHNIVAAAAEENKKNSYCHAMDANGESFTSFVLLRATMVDGYSTEAFCIDSTGFAGKIPVNGNGFTSPIGLGGYEQSITCQ